MSNLDDDTIKDIELAREIISSTDYSPVVIQYNKIWKQKKGEGVKEILTAIEEMKYDINETIIGTRFLDKATALLCRYAKVKGVYAPRATKTGIALLIMAGIPSEIDEMIPNIESTKEDFCCFDELLADVDKPEKAYKILKEAVK